MDDLISIESLIESADGNERLMDGTIEPVMRLLHRYEIVVALWKDAREPHGVGSLMVKGHTRLKQALLAGTYPSAPFTVSAFYCEDRAVAEAYLKGYGDEMFN